MRICGSITTLQTCDNVQINEADLGRLPTNPIRITTRSPDRPDGHCQATDQSETGMLTNPHLSTIKAMFQDPTCEEEHEKRMKNMKMGGDPATVFFQKLE